MHKNILISNIKKLIKKSPKLTSFLRYLKNFLLLAKDETIFILSFRKGIKIKIREDFNLKVHPTAYRISYRAFIDGSVRAELDNFINHCTPNMILYDVGSQFGIFSLAALHYTKNSIAIAFDPSPKCIRLMEIIRDINGFDDRFFINQIAIGDRNDIILFQNAGAKGGYQYKYIRSGHNGIQVIMKKLDQILFETKIKPTHIKIDVEGFGMFVLKGAKYILKEITPKIFLEIHNEYLKDFGLSMIDIHKFLEMYNYKLIYYFYERSNEEIFISRETFVPKELY